MEPNRYGENRGEPAFPGDSRRNRRGGKEGGRRVIAEEIPVSGSQTLETLSQRMGLTKELQKSASDQLSIYEIDQPRGSRDTYHRAVMMLDAVNSELLLAVRQLWQQQVLVGIEAAEAGTGRVRA